MMAEELKQLVLVGGKKYKQILHEDGRIELVEQLDLFDPLKPSR